MAWESNLVELGNLVANASMASNQYKFVKSSGTNNEFAICAIDGEFALGVLQDKPASGGAGAIAVNGITKVEAGETLVAGDFVGTNVSGTAKVVMVGVTAQDLGNHFRGYVLEGAAVGELATIQLLHGHVEEA